jgi:predicted lipid-binding transport protein (Tim44 family)
VAVIGTVTSLAVDATQPVFIGLIFAAAAGGAAYAASVRWPRLSSVTRQRIRSRRAELAAEEAVLEDPAFDPATVKAAAAELHTYVVAAWSVDDRHRLAELLGPQLFDEWVRRLDDLRHRRWTNPLRRRGRLHIRYVGLVNRTGDAEDRVVVHLRVRMVDAIFDRHGQMVPRDPDDSGRHTHSEYWTLGKRGGQWILVSVETEQEGAHHLTDPLIPAPWADDRLQDLATLERAAATAVSPAKLAEIVPLEFTGDLRTAALDLAGFDGRYDPDVLEAAARQAVAAWAEAIDGNHEPLLALSNGPTVDGLLYPEPDRSRRLVIRGPRLRTLRIVALEPNAKPPALTVEATVTARRYLENRANGAITEGTRKHDSTVSLLCDLRLTDTPEMPWRIAAIRILGPAHGLLYRYTLGLAGEILGIFGSKRSFAP